MRHRRTSDRGTCLHGNRTHVSVIGIVAVGMMQANVDAKIDPVILRIPPAGIHDLVCIRSCIDGTIRDTIIHAVMAVVVYPATKAVGPVSAAAGIAYAGLRRRRSRWRRDRTILIRHIARKCNNAVVECIVGCGMIEDGFLGREPGIGRIQKRRNSLCRRRAAMFGCRAAHTEEKYAKNNGCENVPGCSRHKIPL